jgi:hypothetical protein
MGLEIYGEKDREETLIVARHVIKQFDWYDYGLDFLGELDSDEWARDLAIDIVSALESPRSKERR